MTFDEKKLDKRVGGPVTMKGAVDLLKSIGIVVPEHFEAESNVPRSRLEIVKPPPPNAAELARERSAAAVRDRATRLRELKWPRRALDHALAAKQTPALDVVQSWSRTSETMLVLAGNKGIGKTVAAAWHAVYSKRAAAMRFVRAATVLRESRFGEAWATLVDAPALCIDDLGAEYLDVKGSFVSNMDELIDTFYSDERPLIITTNLDGNMFCERYGVRVTDRLNECARWSEVPGESLRGSNNDDDREDVPWSDE